MGSWISAHFIDILVVVAAIILARKGFAWLRRHGSGEYNPRGQKSFCNKCGWKGLSLKVKGACDHCGSRNITLSTS